MRKFQGTLFAHATSLLIALSCIPLHAQGVITFTAKNTATSTPVQLDSILVKNHSRARQTTLIGKNSFDLSIFTGINESSVATAFTVQQGYPNAFTQRASFGIDLPASSSVDLAVRSISGARVAALTQELDGGRHRFTFTGGRLPAGIYFVDISAGGATRTIKLMKLGAGNGIGGTIAYDGPEGPSAHSPAPTADIFTFVGYASGFIPDTMLYLSPTGSTNYEFLMVPLPAANGISFGAFTELLRRDIPAGGGTATVNAPGNPLNGMQIEVPQSSFPDTRGFVISSAPVLGHSFGSDFNPVTPVIRISNGGGFSDSVMMIRIPINIQEDEFAMAFYYDEAAGKLEGMPVLKLTNTEIWTAASHFSHAQLGLGKYSTWMNGAEYVDLVVAAVRKGRLSGSFMTGFRPGVDDWEFPNFGSYIATRGQCSGQALAALWYYSQKKLKEGAPSLNSRFDEVHTDSMWMDNRNGYRFCSVLHKQAGERWDAKSEYILRFPFTGNSKLPKDSIQYLAFAYAIKTTNLPQYTGIHTADLRSGHAMIVYGVDNGVLKISDPNYPGEPRSTWLVSESFKPYESKPQAGQPPKLYSVIQYAAKSVMISVDAFPPRWAQFENKTIGSVSPYSFPDVQLYYLDGAVKKPLPDNLNVTADSILIWAECPTCGVTYSGNITHLYVRQENGTLIGQSQQTDGVVDLEPFEGTHRYGLAVFGWPSSNTFGFIDFRWMTVTKSPRLTINPAAAMGNMNEEISFTAHLKAPMPSPSTYVWNFGDGTADVRVANDSTVKHTFAQSGIFTVTARLLDKNNAVISTGSGSANIGLSIVGRWKYTRVLVEETCPGGVGMKDYSVTTTLSGDQLCITWDIMPDTSLCRTIVMTSPTTFTINWSGYNSGGTTFSNTGTGTITDKDHWSMEYTATFKQKDSQGNLVDCTRRFTESFVRL